jgi:SAM-dependent methyltransferase
MDGFNKWLFDTIQPFIKENILEIGSGIGNISGFLLSHYSQVSLSDMRPEYLDLLKNKFAGRKELRQVIPIDLNDSDLEWRYPQLKEGFDTIIASNVIEHIERDSVALRNCHKLLKKGGTLIVLVPAYQSLFNGLDAELGHFRRYTRQSLKHLIKACGFKVVHSSYFNIIGILGWWLNGKLMGKRVLPEDQLRAFNRMVPIFRLLDNVVFHQVGLSVIAIGEK